MKRTGKRSTSAGDLKRIRKAIADSAQTVHSLMSQSVELSRLCRVVVAALKRGGKVLTAGNGGSAAEALHMAEELTGRFRHDRVSLPGYALVADPTALTCIANDFGYDRVFSRQVEGLGRRGDVLVLFSTSGKAPNLRHAARVARSKGLTVVCLLGKGGGPLAGVGDHELIVQGRDTERIQEAHQVILHVILDAVEAAYA